MRILGLDIGQKTIGVAISDPLGFTAQGITTIRRKKKEEDINEIINLCKEYVVETIVVGLPKNMNGSPLSSFRNKLYHLSIDKSIIIYQLISEFYKKIEKSVFQQGFSIFYL